MGHLHLYRLPDRKAWLLLRELLQQGVPAAQIAHAILNASQAGFKRAMKDETLNYSFWLLTRLILASNQSDFSTELKKLGITMSNAPSFMEIMAGFTEAVDTFIHVQKDTSDIGEMAQMAAVETLSKIAGSNLPDMFSSSFKDAQDALQQCASPENFSKLSHEFFNRFTFRYMDYFLSRVIAFYVGPSKTFKSYHEHLNLRQAFQTHCWETSHIVQHFAAPWYSKNVSLDSFNQTMSQHFVTTALEQIRDELKDRGTVYGQ